jgi:hypothetical protein
MALPPPAEALDEESVVDDEGGAGERTMRGRPRRRLAGGSGGVSVAERSAVDVGILCCWWDTELLLPSWFCFDVDAAEGGFDADAFLPTPPGGVIAGVPGLPFTRTLGLAPGSLA